MIEDVTLGCEEKMSAFFRVSNLYSCGLFWVILKMRGNLSRFRGCGILVQKKGFVQCHQENELKNFTYHKIDCDLTVPTRPILYAPIYCSFYLLNQKIKYNSFVKDTETDVHKNHVIGFFPNK